MKLAQSTEFDIAILDVNVNGKVISPVAELIKARNRPFIFATGYGSSGLPEEYRDRPALQKPFQLETLAQDDRHRAEEPGGLGQTPQARRTHRNTKTYRSVVASASENSSSVRSSRSGVTET